LEKGEAVFHTPHRRGLLLVGDTGGSGQISVALRRRHLIARRHLSERAFVVGELDVRRAGRPWRERRVLLIQFLAAELNR